MSAQSPSAREDSISSVLLVTPTWGRDGGVATHVQASALALARSGISVDVLAARVQAETFPGVTLHHRSELLRADAPLEQRLGEWTSLHPSLVHLHQRDDRAMVNAIRAYAPVAISAHGYPGCTAGEYYFTPGHECTRGHGPGCIPNLIARGCAHTRYPRTLPRKYREVTRGLAALRGADVAISYSSAVDRHLANNAIADRAIVPLFPTMPLDGVRREPVEGRVVFAGRIEQPKGVAVLLRAAVAAECELVICGDGRQLDAMRALAERLGIGERVRFTGWLAPAQLAEELAQAAVVVVPSLWPEPFGLVGIEALALGRPVIASATGGIADWLTDEVGVAVRPGDERELARALAQLLGDPARRRTLGAAGRRRVAERFSAELHARTLLDAYRSARARWLRSAGRAAAADLTPPGR